MSTQFNNGSQRARIQAARTASIGLLLLALVNRADAREWHVFPDSSGDAPFLQAAIDSASDGDMIHLVAGAHSGDYVLVVEKSLTIYGDGPSTQSPTINFAGNDTEAMAVVRDLTVHGSVEGGFSFKRMESALVERCVISDTEFGLNVNSVKEVTIRDCMFQSNHHPARCGTYPSGGAISIQGGGFDQRYLIERCTFLRNSSSNCASGYGAGAISIATSWKNSTEITRCLFVGNSAPTGGAIGLSVGDSNIHHNLFVANEAEDAVIFEDDFAEGRVYGNVFAHNETSGIWSFTIGFRCGCNVFWRNDSPDPRQYVGDCNLFDGAWPDAILDPLLCGWRAGDYTVAEMSPVLLPYLPGEMQGICDEGIDLGAVEVGCKVVPTVQTSWGALKKRFAEPKQ